MRKTLTSLAALVGFAAFSSTAFAADCDPGKAGSELSPEEAQSVYDCLADELHAGYIKGDKIWIPAEYVKDYRGWVKASDYPAAPGFHGGRFLFTYVNSIGAEEYLLYKEEDVNIPAGTLIAKESFSVNDDGKVQKGPLFIMEKVEAGKSPESDDWYYMAVAANGSPMAVNVMTACVECHQENFGHQGGLGYPVPEARISN